MKDSASDEDFEPDMPPPGTAGYLLVHFWEVGPTLGDGAITSAEIRHYQDNTGIDLTPWECTMLRRLSIEYLSESNKATKLDCPPPFGESSDAARLKQAELQQKLDLFLS